MDIVVVGSANLDYLIKGPRLPRPGETIAGSMFLAAPGGKGANQAVAAARLGAEVALVARIGNDRRGDALLEQLAEEQVRTMLIQRDDRAGTGVALVFVDDQGQKSILTALGANERLSIPERGATADAIRAAKVLVLQLEVPISAVREAARIAKAEGVKVVLDASPASPLSDELLRMIDVLRANAREAEALTNVRVSDRGSARWAA